jgi:CRP-like cAMP-binding protein
VVETGTVEIIKDGEIVATLSAGGCFGELALLYSSPRAAAARAQGKQGADDTAVKLWGLEKRVFRRLIARSINRGEAALCHWLRGVPLLQPLTKHDLLVLASGAETVYYWAGEVIVRQGDVGDAMYIIRSSLCLLLLLYYLHLSMLPANLLRFLTCALSPRLTRQGKVKCSVFEAQDERGESLARELQVNCM